MSFFGDLAGNVLAGGLGFIGDNQNRQFQKGQANQSYDAQKEFAQNSIQWKVEDARKAGISPLAALGASGYQYSPVSVMDDGGSGTWHTMGQNLSRSIANAQSATDRQISAADVRIKNANADLAETQAKLAAWELAHRQVTPANPAVPSVSSKKTYQDLVEPDGSVVRVPSAQYAQASFGDIGGQWTWALKNKLIPSSEALWQNAVVHPLVGKYRRIKSEIQDDVRRWKGGR